MLDKVQLRTELMTAYIEAFNTRSIEPVLDILHADFYFRWADGCGIRGELKYIGHLCKAFADFRKYEESITAELIYLDIDDRKVPAIKILAPVNTRIIFPVSGMFSMDGGFPQHNNDIILYCTVKHKKLHRVICYASQKNFEEHDWWKNRK